jgi:large subunit ribosomal protein L35
MGYKLKTHSSAKKRFKPTGSGLKRRSASRSHILTKQSTKRKRHNRGMIKMSDETKKIAQKLLYNT